MGQKKNRSLRIDEFFKVSGFDFHKHIEETDKMPEGIAKLKKMGAILDRHRALRREWARHFKDYNRHFKDYNK